MGGSVENEHRIPLETLPTELQGALAVFDVDGDGSVSVAELVRAVRLYKSSTAGNRRLARTIGMLFGLVFLLVLLNAGFTFYIVDSLKDTKLTAKGVSMVKGTNTPSSVAPLVLNTSATVAAGSAASSIARRRLLSEPATGFSGSPMLTDASGSPITTTQSAPYIDTVQSLGGWRSLMQASLEDLSDIESLEAEVHGMSMLLKISTAERIIFAIVQNLDSGKNSLVLGNNLYLTNNTRPLAMVCQLRLHLDGNQAYSYLMLTEVVYLMEDGSADTSKDSVIGTELISHADANSDRVAGIFKLSQNETVTELLANLTKEEEAAGGGGSRRRLQWGWFVQTFIAPVVHVIVEVFEETCDMFPICRDIEATLKREVDALLAKVRSFVDLATKAVTNFADGVKELREAFEEADSLPDLIVNELAQLEWLPKCDDIWGFVKAGQLPPSVLTIGDDFEVPRVISKRPDGSFDITFNLKDWTDEDKETLLDIPDIILITSTHDLTINVNIDPHLDCDKFDGAMLAIASVISDELFDGVRDIIVVAMEPLVQSVDLAREFFEGASDLVKRITNRRKLLMAGGPDHGAVGDEMFHLNRVRSFYGRSLRSQADKQAVFEALYDYGYHVARRHVKAAAEDSMRRRVLQEELDLTRLVTFKTTLSVSTERHLDIDLTSNNFLSSDVLEDLGLAGLFPIPFSFSLGQGVAVDVTGQVGIALPYKVTSTAKAHVGLTLMHSGLEVAIDTAKDLFEDGRTIASLGSFAGSGLDDASLEGTLAFEFSTKLSLNLAVSVCFSVCFDLQLWADTQVDYGADFTYGTAVAFVDGKPAPDIFAETAKCASEFLKPQLAAYGISYENDKALSCSNAEGNSNFAMGLNVNIPAPILGVRVIIVAAPLGVETPPWLQDLLTFIQGSAVFDVLQDVVEFAVEAVEAVVQFIEQVGVCWQELKQRFEEDGILGLACPLTGCLISEDKLAVPFSIGTGAVQDLVDTATGEQAFDGGALFGWLEDPVNAIIGWFNSYASCLIDQALAGVQMKDKDTGEAVKWSDVIDLSSLVSSKFVLVRGGTLREPSVDDPHTKVLAEEFGSCKDIPQSFGQTGGDWQEAGLDDAVFLVTEVNLGSSFERKACIAVTCSKQVVAVSLPGFDLAVEACASASDYMPDIPNAITDVTGDSVCGTMELGASSIAWSTFKKLQGRTQRPVKVGNELITVEMPGSLYANLESLGLNLRLGNLASVDFTIKDGTVLFDASPSLKAQSLGDAWDIFTDAAELVLDTGLELTYMAIAEALNGDCIDVANSATGNDGGWSSGLQKIFARKGIDAWIDSGAHAALKSAEIANRVGSIDYMGIIINGGVELDKLQLGPIDLSFVADGIDPFESTVYYTLAEDGVLAAVHARGGANWEVILNGGMPEAIFKFYKIITWVLDKVGVTLDTDIEFQADITAELWPIETAQLDGSARFQGMAGLIFQTNLFGQSIGYTASMPATLGLEFSDDEDIIPDVCLTAHKQKICDMGVCFYDSDCGGDSPVCLDGISAMGLDISFSDFVDDDIPGLCVQCTSGDDCEGRTDGRTVCDSPNLDDIMGGTFPTFTCIEPKELGANCWFDDSCRSGQCNKITRECANKGEISYVLSELGGIIEDGLDWVGDGVDDLLDAGGDLLDEALDVLCIWCD